MFPTRKNKQAKGYMLFFSFMDLSSSISYFQIQCVKILINMDILHCMCNLNLIMNVHIVIFPITGSRKIKKCSDFDVEPMKKEKKPTRKMEQQ